MRERKQYPDVSDEELDRRAEEILKRMGSTAAPQRPQGQPPQNNGNPNNNNNNRQRRKKHRR
jgi:hypothetical protein